MKCFLWFGHKYSQWRTFKATTNNTGYYVFQDRTCEHCGKVQLRRASI